MNNDYLKDEANVLRVQKHQLDNTEDKLYEVDNILSTIQEEQVNNDILLDNMIDDMENLLESSSIEMVNIDIEDNISLLEKELNSSKHKENISLVKKLDKIEINDNMSWDEYITSIEEYGLKHNIDLKEDPFKHIMTKSQQIELQKRIKDEFTLKNAQCDEYDYMIAGTCGVIAGLVDILFVGAPGDSKLGDIADEQANNITEKFAKFLGWDKSKAEARGSDTTKSAIGWLEKKFKINYDQATTNGKNGTGGLVENLSASNHHLKSLGHSPDIIGLFFSVLNQFTNTSSFINNGKIITIDTETLELQGGSFIAKIFCGVVNWFGHLMSDWTGSSGAKGRGSGIPIPFYNLLQMMNFGEFQYTPNPDNKKTAKLTFAQISTKVFEQGYDARHGMAMAVPVLINELLIRFMYTMKARFYHEKVWKECIPKENIPEVRRMLLVGHGVLCMIDGADAYWRTKTKGTPVQAVEVLLRMNLVAWVRFGHLGLKELNAWWNEGHIDVDVVDEYLDNDLKRMLKSR